MRRALIPMVVLMLLVAACGGSKKDASLTGGAASAAQNAAASTKPGTSSAPKKTTGTKTGTTINTGGQTTGSAPKAAPKGAENPPKDGQYVYDLTGKHSDMSNPAGPDQSYSKGATVTNDETHNGNVHTSTQSNSEVPGTTTLQTRWEPNRVLLLSVDVLNQLGEFKCTYNPPPVITHFPIKVETFPVQNLKGSGNFCGGQFAIQVFGKETATDATGKSWSTWRVKVHIELKNDTLSTTIDEMRWISPDLGTSIRTDGTSQGTYKANPATTFKFHNSSKTVLKKHP